MFKCLVRAVCAGAVVIAAPAALAHDVQGLLVDPRLPKETVRLLKERQTLREPQVAQALKDAANLPAAQRQAVLKAKGIRSTNFESSLESVFSKSLWPDKTLLDVCFLNGSKDARSRVIAVFTELANETNLGVKQSTETCQSKTSQIRVSFRDEGYSSYVGTDALLIPYSLPTMKLQNLDVSEAWTPSQRAVVMHEVLHAYGALHEHQHPSLNCQKEFDLPRIQTALKWTDLEMKTNFEQFTFGQVGATSDSDKTSLMFYQFAPEYFKRGAASPCYLAAQNTEPSKADLTLLRAQYPK